MLNKVCKTILIILGSTLLVIFMAYLVVSAFYIDSFLPGTNVNGRDISGMSVENANTYLVSTFQPGVDYDHMALVIEGRDGFEKTLKGKDFSLAADMTGDLEQIKESQKPYQWLFYYLYPSEYKAIPALAFNEIKLQSLIKSLECVGNPNTDPIAEVELRHDSEGFHLYDNIIDHADAAMIYDKADKAIRESKEAVIKIDVDDCYEAHVIPDRFKKVVGLYDKIKRVEESAINYTDAPLECTLKGSTVVKWIVTDQDGIPVLDEDGNLTFDESSIESYTDTLSKTFDTVDGYLDWKKKDGTTVRLQNALPGFKVDTEAEAELIKETFIKGDTVSRKPVYTEEGIGRGQNAVGKTYIEVDMSAQKLYYYENRVLKLESDVVTGNLSRGNGTPAKMCYVYFKQRNRTLRGPNYETFVNYWMAVSGHIGIHDATWRSKFGGEIYKTAGSHGCVNVPKSFAAELYEVVEVGTPCILYY